MKKIILLLLMLCAISSSYLFAQSEAGNTKLLIAGHTTVTATLDSGQSNISNANFSAIFLYQLSEKLFVESEIEIETGGGEPDIGLEHANLVWLIGKNVILHAGRFVPHFGMYRGRLGEGFMNRFPTDPVGYGDGGIGTMEAVGFGFQGGFPLGTAKMNYDLWLSNGPQLLSSAEDAGQFEYEAYIDNNKNKALGGRIGFLPFSNSCLEIGVSYESAAKTQSQADLYNNTFGKDIGVMAMALDLNFYHKVDALKSTVRVVGEYKNQKVDNVDYHVDTLGTVYSFDNKSNTYYGMISIRPSNVENKVLRNFELAFRYSKFHTPNGAPWANYDSAGNNVDVKQTAISLNYWLKWNCVLKLCYQQQTNVTNQVFAQIYYGF